MTPAERLVATALAENGYREKASNANLDNPTANAGTANWNKFAAELDKTDIMNGPKNGYDWCACFVVWCFYKTFGLELFRKITGIPAKSAAAGVGFLRQYFSNIGGLVSVPQPGDVIFFRNAAGNAWQHTGIVTKVADGCVETVEGNAGTPQGVNTFRYALGYNRIGGYGRAKWDLVPEDKPAASASPAPSVTSPDPAISKPSPAPEASSWSAEARSWAIQKGLFSGDGNGNYDWLGNVTREQLAVLLYKFVQLK